MTRRIKRIFAEGFLDRLAAEKIVKELRLTDDDLDSFDAGGNAKFWEKIGKYNEAAKQIGLIFALADHDSDKCVGPKLREKVPEPHQNLLLRLSVHELESWLLADHETLAQFIRVPKGKFPEQPDRIKDPKQALVNLASQSSKPDIKKGMVPPPRHSITTGKEYSSYMEKYIQDFWRPLIAMKRSPSLKRAIDALCRACHCQLQSELARRS